MTELKVGMIYRDQDGDYCLITKIMTEEYAETMVRIYYDSDLDIVRHAKRTGDYGRMSPHNFNAVHLANWLENDPQFWVVESGIVKITDWRSEIESF